MMLHNLNETMDELFRYGAKDTDENVIFLKNILVFLSYISIYEDEASWRDLLLKWYCGGSSVGSNTPVWHRKYV